MCADVLPQPTTDPPPEPTPAPETVPPPSRDVKELRLGLVCYGGVSLAIYMHGITKELHRAIRASVLEEQNLESASDAVSERAYRDLLRALGDERNVHTRIVVDTIAGSSAGGINGIFLAKALAHDLSQDALRDLWFDLGDLAEIIREPEGVRAWIEERLVDLLPLGDEDDVPSRDAKEKLVIAGLRVHADPLLEGDAMTTRIYGALDGMKPSFRAESPDGPASLMPERHELELSVTVTDYYGYPRHLPITDPPVVAEGQHRHVLEFSYRSDRSTDFGSKENAALTLAARATSSLPLAFEPVHVGSFPGKVPAGATTSTEIERFFRAYPLADVKPGWAYLVDGGVLDNKPFGPVLRAIKQRHAANEVDRYLIFIEPDPKPPKPAEKEPTRPKPIPALLGALSGLPRSEPILDELHDLLVRNEHVRAVRDAIEANWTPIEKEVLKIVTTLDKPPPDAGDPVLRAWSDEIHDAAIALGRLAYPMYVRLKISSAVDTFASAACVVCEYTDASNQAFLVRALVRDWARTRKLFEHENSPTPTQLAFVRDFDLDYAQRRLYFVIAGVSWLYRDLKPDGQPTRGQLDAIKARLYEAVSYLEWLSSGTGFADEVLGGVRTCFGQERLNSYLETHNFDTEKFLEEHGDELDVLNASLRTFLREKLQTFTPRLYCDLIALTKDWADTEETRKIRRDLLIRYLGFPIWDATLYPLQALSAVGERDAVRVARVSPADSTVLAPVRTGGKVMGAQLGHAYAFFSRKARENDYLWGRLDAAERVVRLLLTESRTVNGVDRLISGERHPDYRSRCKQAFAAVLAEDGDHLPAIADDVEALRKQLEALE